MPDEEITPRLPRQPIVSIRLPRPAARPRRAMSKGTIAFIAGFCGYLGWESARFAVAWIVDPHAAIVAIRHALFPG